MTQALVNYTGSAVAGVLKNTHCTVTLSGWPAALTIIASTVSFCGAFIAATALTNRSKDNDLVIDDNRSSY